MKPGLAILCATFLLASVLLTIRLFGLRDQNHRLAAENNALTQTNDFITTKIALLITQAEEFKSNVQSAIESQEIAGLYECKSPSSGRYQQLDLRSDGSGQFNDGYTGTRSRQCPWKKLTDTTVFITDHGNFTIEVGDLIDEHGLRWLHIR